MAELRGNLLVAQSGGPTAVINASIAGVIQQAGKRGWEMRVIGIPKTIDNDLPHTDHCPGYGSVIKYNGATLMEIAIDVGSMATDDGACCIIEVMGRSAGWIAAGSVLAKRHA